MLPKTSRQNWILSKGTGTVIEIPNFVELNYISYILLNFVQLLLQNKTDFFLQMVSVELVKLGC